MGTEDERQERFPMPKNKGKGGKSRRRGKGDNGLDKRELIFKEDGQEYAQVLTMLGGGRLEAQCFDGIKRLCGIRGKMRKRVWIFQGDKADVILKYSADEARNLKAYGELPETAKINESAVEVEFGDDDDVEFDFDEIDDI